jgi:hypothetical protein
MCAGLGVRVARLEPQGGGFFVEGAGAKAARIPLRRAGAFFESLPFPTDASGAYRPDPQATTELASEGYTRKMFPVAFTGKEI